ncbi:lipopolysaccharide heptosyltransferase family protein [Pasteurella canis]|uniref:glycosyltransferase family 9 protein n=1 Tax=Pasteurella canis TaxID=753 RepID=UPI001E28F895|nr:glycosyltransferase family 9 protein [Pasteurella canis]UEA15994.1 lipopolysaccharide heptosyltransferase family protein [Pasteurella canis]
MNFKQLFILLLENRQKQPSPIQFNQVKSILLRPLGFAIGDAAVHTAHLKQLKALFPQAKLGVVVRGANKAIYQASGLVDEFVERNLFSYIKHSKKWDLLLDFENNFNSSSLFMDRILMPKWIVIFRKYNKKYYNFETIKSYDIHCPQKDNARLSHYLMQSVFAEHFVLPEPESVLNTTKENRQKVENFWQNNKFRLLLCPQGSKRQIPESELATLLNASLVGELNQKVECLVGYTPTAQNYCAQLIQLCPTLEIKCSPKTSLDEYLALVESADLVVAVDGGSLHLACAFQKPLLSFFANSQPNLGTWEPLIPCDIPHLKVISAHSENTTSGNTQNFPLEKAIPWLTQQITRAQH